jgi:hypothetical protein
MRPASFRDTLARLVDALTTLVRGPEFSCGDCERNERCGLATSRECIVRAAQIERDGDRPERRRTLIGL